MPTRTRLRTPADIRALTPSQLGNLDEGSFLTTVIITHTGRWPKTGLVEVNFAHIRERPGYQWAWELLTNTHQEIIAALNSPELCANTRERVEFAELLRARPGGYDARELVGDSLQVACELAYSSSEQMRGRSRQIALSPLAETWTSQIAARASADPALDLAELGGHQHGEDRGDACGGTHAQTALRLAGTLWNELQREDRWEDETGEAPANPADGWIATTFHTLPSALRIGLVRSPGRARDVLLASLRAQW